MTELEAPGGDTSVKPSEPRAVSRDRARQARAAASSRARRSSGHAAAGDGTGRPVVVHRRIWPYALVSLVALVGLVALAWVGYNASLDVRGGTALNAGTDPSKPGYEARVKPTPTHLIIPLASDGRIDDPVLLVEGSKGGGNFVFVPGLTVVTVEGKPYNLTEVATQLGVPKLVESIQEVLGIAITDAVELGPEEVTELLGSAGPLEIENPDPVRVGDEVAFPAGQIELSPGDVPRFLAAFNVGEPVVNRPFRAQQVWEAWLKKVPSSPPRLAAQTVISGDGTLDITALVTRIAGGAVTAQQLPLDRKVVPDMGGFAVYQPNVEAINELMASVVPFPGSAFPGQRARVRLLNGTKDPNATLRAARPIVAAGGQVVVIGNASSFDVASTRVEYNAESQKAAAQAIAEKLGVAEATPGVESDAADVTVTIGADAR